MIEKRQDVSRFGGNRVGLGTGPIRSPPSAIIQADEAHALGQMRRKIVKVAAIPRQTRERQKGGAVAFIGKGADLRRRAP